MSQVFLKAVCECCLEPVVSQPELVSETKGSAVLRCPGNGTEPGMLVLVSWSAHDAWTAKTSSDGVPAIDATSVK